MIFLVIRDSVISFYHFIYERNNVPRNGQGLGREKDGNHARFMDFNLVILCYKDFKNLRCADLFGNRKPHLLLIVSQSRVDMQKLIFYNGSTFKM